MEKKLILELKNHNVYYIKNDIINYYITIPTNNDTTNICLELKTNMSNYNLELNDEIWVMENVKNTFSYIDEYNITLVLPILNEKNISILEKIDDTRYSDIDKLLGYVINTSYQALKEENKLVSPQIILVNNDRYKTFINWFITKYNSRVVCKTLLELIQYFNAGATSYKKLETPVMNFVVGSYNTEVTAPKAIKLEDDDDEKMPAKKEAMASSGIASYWLLAIITLVVAGIVAFIAFHYK